MWELITWWCYRRWTIYCPAGDYSHLFTDVADRMDLFCHGIVDFNEAFVSPCTLNEHNCGGIKGKWTPKIAFIDIPDCDTEEEDKDYNEDQ